MPSAGARLVVSAAKRAVAHDPTVYPVLGDMGEGCLQRLVSELLRILVERWLAQRGKPTFVGADQFFYWKQFDASEGIAPDVYVLPGAPLSPDIGAWKVWESGHVPSFAFEFVSRDLDKDYLQSPPKYARLGVRELVVFDPDYLKGRSRVRWQVFRKTKHGFHRVLATDADRVKSVVLGCHLRAVGEGGDLRVRLGTGFNGEALLPTDLEALQAKDEALHAKDEALEAERARRAALEAELAALRAVRWAPRKRR